MSAKPYIEWRDELATGIAVFDREHRGMAAAINRLHEVVVDGLDDAAFAEAVDALIHLSEEHFAHEERVLREHRCANLAAHQREHDELLDDVTALRLLGNGPDEVDNMLKMLHDWLIDHILHFDSGYRRCLEGKEIR